ncbi:MAG: amylo-alpha-1,6-glucosidase [Prevotella sp.]|nr:amylo-alpha-1,6-glucosidase [Prevotella sp.]
METTYKATWIWYPGDFEVWLGNKFNNRRTERGAMFPPFWKQDSHWTTVEFSKTVILERKETISIKTEGMFNLMIDGKLQFGMPEHFDIEAGEHKINIKIHNPSTPPALFIEGETINTDSTWLATYEDKIWIDENGIAHGSGIYVPAAQWMFNSADTPPSKYQLCRKHCEHINSESINNKGILYDFGKETFGYLKFSDIRGVGNLYIYYGESREEALDKEYCETLDRIQFEESASDNRNFTVNGSKAFRYVYIETDNTLKYDNVSMDYEYAPFLEDNSGMFKCNDELINKIWEIGAYTMDLTTREFFVDGIKRDRWTWSGDAIQSYLMNYYLRFDNECVKRTIRQLRGKDPVTAHINTIMDYTFYWFKSVYDYYLYTGDVDFVREIYPRMQTMMEYVLNRTNHNGMAEGKDDDWIFVDWVDFPMHKRGTLCFEQILFCKSLETMQMCASVLLDKPLDNPPQGSIKPEEYAKDVQRYSELANSLRDKLKPTFWDDKKKAFKHAIEDGIMNEQITKFPNMFAIIYDYLSEEEKKDVMTSVMLNPEIEDITTPYMRFYELEALCQMGMQEQVIKEIRDYWGGMIKQNATSFWEKYNPNDKGRQHLTMYGRPYGKSLCHAWGASPIYLIGKYYLGVQPTKAGYEEYIVKPTLGDLEWMEGDVPTPYGKIHIYMDKKIIRIYSNGGNGKLIVNKKEITIPINNELTFEL